MLLVLVGVASMLVPAHHKLQRWVTEKLAKRNSPTKLILSD